MLFDRYSLSPLWEGSSQAKGHKHKVKYFWRQADKLKAARGSALQPPRLWEANRKAKATHQGKCCTPIKKQARQAKDHKHPGRFEGPLGWYLKEA